MENSPLWNFNGTNWRQSTVQPLPATLSPTMWESNYIYYFSGANSTQLLNFPMQMHRIGIYYNKKIIIKK